MSEKTYEENIAKLEEIVRHLEQGDQTLENSLAWFEEGIKIIRLCQKQLDKVSERIQVLTHDVSINTTEDSEEVK